MSADTAIQAEVENNYRHNFIFNALDGTTFWFGYSFIAARTILPLYVSRLSDSTLAIGLLATIVSTGWFLPQLFTSNWVQRLPVKKVVPVKFGFFSERVPVFLLVPGAWLATKSETTALVVFFVLIAWHILGAGAVAVGWQDMLAKIFPRDRRGRFFGFTNFGGTATGILGASIAAGVLDYYDFPFSYMICFAIASLFIFISWIFLAQTREPAQTNQKEHTTQREFWRLLPDILRSDLNFRRYLVSQIVITMGSMALGFLAVYAVIKWQLPDSRAGRFTASMLVGQALSSLLFGWLADRSGHKLVLELGTLAGVLSLGLAILAPDPIWFYMVFALIGINTTGFIISGTMIVFEFSDAEIRPTYIGLNSTVIGIIAAVMPLLGGWLANTFGYQVVFISSFIISIMGLALLRWTVREPRLVSSGGSDSPNK